MILAEEIERAYHLVKNSHCFNIEATSQVAALAGSQTLWNRPQPLLSPLQHINYWSGKLLKDEDTLAACKIVDKATILLVKGAAPGGGDGGSATARSAAKEEKKDY